MFRTVSLIPIPTAGFPYQNKVFKESLSLFETNFAADR